MLSVSLAGTMLEGLTSSGIMQMVSQANREIENWNIEIFGDMGKMQREILIESEFKNYSAFNVKIKEASEIEQGIINDSSVRLRTEPSSDSSIILLLEKGGAVKIVDRSDEKFEIDGESHYWYKVESENLPDGWVYGKYLDIEE